MVKMHKTSKFFRFDSAGFNGRLDGAFANRSVDNDICTETTTKSEASQQWMLNL